MRESNQAASYLCDCIEIYLDVANRGGQRVVVLDGRTDWFAKCDPQELRGYELHFLPSEPPQVYLDHTNQYALDKPHTERFRRAWNGEVATQRTATGYVAEIGFTVPGVALQPGQVLGVETGVCDDDGQGRESILMWTGTKTDFWLSMDAYGKATLTADQQTSDQQTSDQQASTASQLAAQPFGTLDSGAVVSAIKTPDGHWGLRVGGAGTASVTQPQPVRLEITGLADERVNVGYDALSVDGQAAVGRAEVSVGPQVQRRCGRPLDCAGRRAAQSSAHCASRVTRPRDLSRPSRGRFDETLTWPQVQWFAPGMIYGGFAHLTDTAIGGRAPLPTRRLHRPDSRRSFARTAVGRAFSTTAVRWPC